MSAIDKERFPRSALIGAASLIAFSLVVTTVGRFERLHEQAPAHAGAEAAPLVDVGLRFLDQPDGSVSVYNAQTNTLIASLQPGTNGFVRGVMRGMARDRKSRGISALPPFRLCEWRDGRVTIADTATGRLIDLNAFGSTNKRAFTQLLNARAA